MKPFRTTWSEFQGDSANSGYVAVRTDIASQTNWTRPAKNPGGGSPIVDPLDGAIYVCDGVGQLSKYEALTGVIKWTYTGGTSEQWGSTPAIDAQGRIYAVFSNLMESVLVCIDRNGTEQWHWSPPGHSTKDFRRLIYGSPKVWNQSNGGSLIFLTVGYLDMQADLQTTLLYVFNHQGLGIGAVWFATSFIFVAGGGGGFSLVKAHALPHLNMQQRKGSPWADVQPVISPGGERPTEPLPNNEHLWEPTCAAIDGDSPDFPIVIATDGIATVAAFQWLGDGGLSLLWKKYPSRDGFPRLTPPAVFPNGLLAIGCSDGDVKLFDPRSGADWKPWPNLGSWVRGTPASFLRQIYVTTMDGQVCMVDSNGILVKKVGVVGHIASSAVVTATNVYVTTSDRLITFDLELNVLFTYQVQKIGVSSPAVGPDGTVYVLMNDELWAFKPPRA